jgi:hypothetical protein
MTTETTSRSLTVCLLAVWLFALGGPSGEAQGLSPNAAAGSHPADPTAASRRALINTYCVGCHNARLKTAELVLETVDAERVGTHAAIWEKVLRKVQSGQMPPVGARRPDAAASAAFTKELAAALDRAAAADPNPGRPAVHRLNRTEYVGAIGELLDLEVDGRALLPADDSGFGFDNNADVLTMSPALLERYMSAATKISRLAIGDTDVSPSITRHRVSRLLRQEGRMSDQLSFGTRGGLAVRHTFPLDGEYVFKVRMKRGDVIIGVDKGDQVEVRLDGVRLQQFTLGGVEEMKGITYTRGVSLPVDRPEVIKRYVYETTADDGFEVRALVKAGTRTVGVAFLKDSSVPEGPLGTAVGDDGQPTGPRSNWPGVDHVQIAGPYNGVTPADTPSRRRIFVCKPTAPEQEGACASRILRTLARRAYRRPVTDADLNVLMSFYESGRSGGGTFDKGIQVALERLLVDPEFLFRVERDPEGMKPGTVHRLSDLELASRLSFFLWNTIPDEELLAAAERGALKDPAVLDRQVRRLLADPRAVAMVTNFTSQWLLVRNARLHVPDVAVFPDFDENLREAFARETELFVESQFREDRSVLDLLRADYSFVNDRLAELYGIPGVYGSHFRRVPLRDERRHGILGQGSVLMVTSYPDRTSPVLRGKWVLDNLLGAPPPPPPPDVPTLQENTKSKPTTVRQRLEQHRENAFCANCHARMDPLGFPLENFDGIGRWRESENGMAIDAKATLPDGATIDGPVAFREALLSRREEFATNVVEKLMTYSLGRGVDYYDAPAVRRIVRETAAREYRWSDIVLGIVKSVPFQMRRTPQS